MSKNFFFKYAAFKAALAGVIGFLYAVCFVVLKDATFAALFLMLSGLVAIPVMVALFDKLKVVDENFARLALIVGIFGAFGYLIHGGYDLANIINPPKGVYDFPNPFDPRGLLAFGATGYAILKFSWLASKSKDFPNGFALLGAVSGLLLLVIYLARLIVLAPTEPILLYPVLLEGFIVNPLWYLWLAMILAKSKPGLVGNLREKLK